MTDTAEPVKESEESESGYPTRDDYITSAYNCIAAMNEFNPMEEGEAERRSDTIRKCFKIIEFYAQEMYDEIFPEEE